MITTESIVAKVILAIVGKLAGAVGGMVVSKRQKACRYLVKLYYAVQALEEVTSRLLETVGSDRKGGAASQLIRALVQEQDALEFASNAFVDLAEDLQRGLALLDPALAELCRVIYRGKGDFLSCMSFGVRPDFSGGNVKVVLWVPNERLDSTDFEQAYELSKAAIGTGAHYYWPDGAFDYLNDCEELEITRESDESAEQVLNYLRRHHATLSAAKERLRELLKSSFTVEELLFHRDETPR
jgi:hypothetical protein